MPTITACILTLLCRAMPDITSKIHLFFLCVFAPLREIFLPSVIGHTYKLITPKFYFLLTTYLNSLRKIFDHFDSSRQVHQYSHH